MGKLRVTYEGDNREAAEAVLNFAVQSSNIVRGMKQQLGIDRMTKVFEAPDGAQVYVLDFEHLRRVHIVPPVPASGGSASLDVVDAFGSIELGVPDYVSGVVLSPIVDEEAMHLPDDDPDQPPTVYPVIRSMRVTNATAERIPHDMARFKLGVLEHPSFAPPDNASGTPWSQHRGIVPGYYTGAMRAVVQVLLGVGFVRPQTYEQRWIDTGEDRQYLAADPDDEETRSAFGLYHGPTPTVLNVTYDYRFNRTHGISWGEDGRCYLVEIGQRGVLVMPLDVDPVSKTEAGRARYEALYPELFDPAWFKGYGRGGSFFEVLGGFPTGASIPQSGDVLDAWIRAGEVVRAIPDSDMEAFYRNLAYSSGMGWAFHPDGREAHNTCWTVREDGVGIGYHYAVSISIGAEAEREPSAEVLEVIGWLGLTGVWRRKALRMDQAQAEAILKIESADVAREAFDVLTVTPAFSVSAALRLQKEGFLYYPGASGQPEIKFPEPLLGALVSFDFSGPPSQRERIRCDTPMFVCFRGSTLTVVNYAWFDQPSQPGGESSTRMPCQFTGAWVTRSLEEAPKTHGHFYSTDRDPRRSLASKGESITTSSGEFVGKTAFLNFCGFFAMFSQSMWEYWHATSFTTETTSSRSLQVSVAIPLGERSVYFMATGEQVHGAVVTSGYSGAQFSGYGSGRQGGAIFDPVFHWSDGGCRDVSINDDGPTRCELRDYGLPYQVESCFHDSISTSNTPYISPCGGGPEAVVSKRFGSVPTGPGAVNTTPTKRTAESEIRIFGDIEISGRVTASDRAESTGGGGDGSATLIGLSTSPWWWGPSPDRLGSYARLAVTTNRFGSSLLAYQPDFNANVAFHGGPAEMRVAYDVCYVGWVA